MQLLILLAVLLCISLAEAAPRTGVESPCFGIGCVALSVVITVALSAVLATIAVCQLRRGEPRGTVLRRLARWQTAHTLLWGLLAAAALHFGQWPQIVRGNWNLGSTVLVDDLLILAPLLVSLLASWAVLHSVDLQLAAEDRSRYGKSTGGDVVPPLVHVTRLQAVGLHARHYLAVPLVPLLLMLGADDLGRLIAPAAPEAWATAALLPPMVLMAAFFPLMLRYLWSTQPLASGPLRERLEKVARDWDVVPREILIWNTQRQMLNAAVAGFLPRLRYVLLSDALVERYRDDEIEAVFAHELAHIRLRHMLKRALVLFLPVAICLAVRQTAPGLVAAGQQWLIELGLPGSLQAAILFPVTMGSYFVLVFAPYSRLLEHEADLAACCEPRANRHAENQPTPQRVERFSAVLEKLGAAAGRRTRSLLHPPISQRIALVEACLVDPAAAQILWRRTGLSIRLCGSLIAGALAVVVTRGWPVLAAFGW